MSILQMENAKLFNEYLETQGHYEFVSKLCADVKRGIMYTLSLRPHVLDPKNIIHVLIHVLRAKRCWSLCTWLVASCFHASINTIHFVLLFC